jgi:hypothetical protein
VESSGTWLAVAIVWRLLLLSLWGVLWLTLLLGCCARQAGTETQSQARHGIHLGGGVGDDICGVPAVWLVGRRELGVVSAVGLDRHRLSSHELGAGRSPCVGNVLRALVHSGSLRGVGVSVGVLAAVILDDGPGHLVEGAVSGIRGGVPAGVVSIAVGIGAGVAVAAEGGTGISNGLARNVNDMVRDGHLLVAGVSGAGNLAAGRGGVLLGETPGPTAHAVHRVPVWL